MPRSKKPAHKPKRPESTGAIVAGANPCVCGHAPEEHGRDPAYSGSTACRATLDGTEAEFDETGDIHVIGHAGDECPCLVYEADPEAR